MRAQEIVQIEGLKIENSKKPFDEYGNGLLLQGLAWIEV
jgi:hypothetical protein